MSVAVNTVKSWVDVEAAMLDVVDVVSGFNMARTASVIVKLYAPIVREDDEGKMVMVGDRLDKTILVTRTNGKLVWKEAGSYTLADQVAEHADMAEEEVYQIKYTRHIPNRRGEVKAEAMSQATIAVDGMTQEAVVKFATDHIVSKMEKARKAVKLSFTIERGVQMIATGKVDNTLTPVVEQYEYDAEYAAKLEADFGELTTAKTRREVMDILSGERMKKYVTASNGKEIRPETIKGFTQQGVYAKTSVLVITEVMVMHNGKDTGKTERKLISRVAYEPAEALGDFEHEFTSVFIASEVFNNLKEEDDFRNMVDWIKDVMKRRGVFTHFIVGRKKRIIFGRKPFGQTDITRDFQNVNINRAEHLGQLITARGIRCVGSIATPELIDSLIADGVVMLLNTRQGAKLGLKAGVWQIRSINPYSKGTIVVMDEVVDPFMNMDAIKVKPQNWPTQIEGKDIIAISNSANSYTMKFSHQLGYVFAENFAKAKGAIKPWGPLPRLIKAQVSRDSVKATLPTEYSRLQSYGLPYEFFRKPEYLMDQLVRSMRPDICKLHMFVALPIERLDREWYDVPGVYMPEDGKGAEGRYMLRIPALAVNGAVQDLYYADAEGNPILASNPSSLRNVIIAAIHEPKVSKNADGEEVLDFPDDVEHGGAGRSRIIWAMLAAMGADSDGDRVGRTLKDIDPILEAAGLKCTFDVPQFKQKNPYDGVDHWIMPEGFGGDEDHDRIEIYAQSTPGLVNVGIGDVITQDCVDLLMEGHMKWSLYKKQCVAGAELVQAGVSSTKYKNVPMNEFILDRFAINDLLKETGVERGYKLRGLLYKPAIDEIEKHLSEFFPAEGEFRDVTVTHKMREWEGGYRNFINRLATFDTQMGDIWITHVKESFKHELIRMACHGARSEAEKQQMKAKFTELYIKGAARERIRGYVAYFINKFPEMAHVWAWMLDEEFIRPMSKDRRPDGRECETPEYNEGRSRILEIMGMPYDLERLEAQKAKLDEAQAKREAKRKNK